MDIITKDKNQIFYNERNQHIIDEAESNRRIKERIVGP
jgi:hypothetical protein